MSKKFYSFLFLLTAFLWLGTGNVWGAQSLPYSYGFENDLLVLEDGWTTQNPSGLNASQMGIVGAAKKTGSYGFRFSSYDDKGDDTQYLISPELNAPYGVIAQFWYRAGDSKGSEIFKVGYSTTDTDLSSFTFGSQITASSTTWTNSGELNFPAGTKYIAIYYYSNWKYYLFVDDFTFTAVAPPASCAEPTAVTATQNTPVKATLSWTKAEGKDNYQYLYVAKNGTPDWTGITAQNTNSVEIDGLTAGTEYDFYVRTYCDESDQSTEVKKTFSVTCPAPTYPASPVTAKTATTATVTWNAVAGMTKYQYVCVAKDATPSWTSPSETTGTSANIEDLTAYTEYDFYVRSWYSATAISDPVKTTFRTECAAVNAPHTWDFEDATTGAVPGCWDNSASTAVPGWGSDDYNWTVYSYSSKKFLRMNNTSLQAGGISLINTPSIVLPASPNQELAFDYSHRASCGDFTVKISTDGGANFTNLQTYSSTASSSSYDPGTYTEVTINLASYAGQTIILQFYAVADYVDGAIFVDNVKIQNAPACPKPTGLGYSEKAAHSVKLNWTSTASAWKVEYADNASFTGSTIVPATTNPFTLSGLEASTHYYVRVLADCSASGDGESAPTAAIDFTTECDPVAIGWSEDFDGASALPECWKTDSYGNSNGQWYMYSNAARFNARVSTSTYVDLITPPISLTDDAILVFSHSGTSVNVAAYVDAGEGEVLLKNIPKKDQNDTCDLSAYKNKTVKVIFRGQGYGYSTVYFYLNDVKVVYKPVALPTALAAEATADGANVTWNSIEGTSWNLQYREKDAEPEAAWIPVNGLTAKSHTLTGLSTEKTYEVQVQSVCSANRISDWTASATFTPVYCPTVTAVTFGAQTYNSIVVNWTTSGVGTWDVHYKAAGDAGWTSAGTSLAEATTTLSGLNTGVAYTVEVKASCSSAWVASAFTLAYSAPASASVTGATDAAASASWDAVADAPNGYEYITVARDAAEDWTSPHTTNATSASLSDLDANTEYDFYVRAVYGSNHGAATKAQFATITIAPQNLQQDGESTIDGATFTWEANGAATQYQWSTDNSTWSPAQTELTATVTGLASGSDYTFYVRSYYPTGVYSSAISLPFHTQCATKSLGWSESFGSSFPACWDNSHYTYWGASYIWNVSSSEKKSGSYSMSIRANKYASTYTADLETPSIVISEKANLTYYWYSESGVPYKVIAKENSVETELASFNTSHTWTNQQTVVIPDSYVGKTITLIFRAQGAGSTANRTLYIDEVAVIARPCPQLADDLAAVPTPDGATITWSQGDDETQYQYCVVDEGEAPVWSAAGVLADGVRTVTISGKTFGNTYDCYVRSYCSASNQSESRMVQFTPSCVAPSDLAAADITDNSASLSWTSNAKALRYKAAGEAEWTNKTIDPVATSYALSGLAASTTYTVQVQAFCAADESEYWSDELAFTTKCGLQPATDLPLSEDFSAGTKPACWEFISTTGYPTVTSEKIWFQGENEQIVVLPGFDIELNALSLTFDFTENFASIELGYLTTIGGAFNSLGAITSGVEKDLATTSAPASAGYLAIRYFNTTSEYATGSVDNVVLRKTPSCLAPTAVAATPGVGSATITWTAGGSETAWNLQYKLASAASWTDAEGTITSPFALNGLEKGITYKVRVQAACAGAELSDWSDEVEFTTNCEDVAALPFIETFDAALSTCWDITDEETATYAHSVYGSELRLPGGKAASGHLVKLPNITASFTNAVMTIEYKATTGENTAVPQVGYIDDLGDFQELVALEKSNTTTEARVNLATVDGKRLALRYDDGTSEGNFDIAEIRILNQLTLADGDDNTATLGAHIGQTLDVTIGRTFVCADYFNTICLPFSLSAEQLAASPIATDDLWAFKYARVEGGELLIRIVEAESINAGEPYLISWPTGDNIVNPLFKNVKISASAGKIMGNENLKFVGTLKPETFNKHDDSKLFLYQNNTLYWWDGDAASYLKSFRAFFTVEGGADTMPIKNLPARIVKEDQEATGIDNTSVDAQALKFLENNQVVIIRNGIKYNIQGQVIEK